MDDHHKHAVPPRFPPGAHLALRFISGKYQGGEFPLSEGATIVVGRSSDLDMVLVEEMVSRRHARIEFKGGIIVVEDLGSTNGTFVNGERVRQAHLAEGDRLLIGTSILKLVAVEELPPGSRRNLQRVAFGKETIRQQSSAASARMSGNLEEIPLPDLMQLFGTSRKSGTLVLQSEKVGRFHLRDGVIVGAQLDGFPAMPPLKAAYRMLGFTVGTFALEPEDATAPTALSLSAQAFLMEGFRQLDEMGALLGQFPSRKVRLGLRAPLRSPISQLEQSRLEVLQACINAPDLQVALDRSPKSDFDTLVDIRELMEQGYLEVLG